VIAGAGLRVDGVAGRLTPGRLLPAAGLTTAVGAFAPGRAWGMQPSGPGRMLVIAGPTPAARWLLVAAAALAVGSAIGDRGVKSLIGTSLLAGSAGLGLALATTVRLSVPPAQRPGMAGAAEHGLIIGGGLTAAVLLVSLGLARLPTRVRIRACGAFLGVACAATVTTTLRAGLYAGPGGSRVSLGAWGLGPAGLLVAATAVVGGLAALGRKRWDQSSESTGGRR